MADTSALRAQANTKSAQKTEKEQAKRVVDQKLERLREVDRQVAIEKVHIENLCQVIRDKEEPGDMWKGQTRQQHSDYVRNDFNSPCQKYYEEVDILHDAVVRKIAELENQSQELGGTINWLTQAINTLLGDIRAASN